MNSFQSQSTLKVGDTRYEIFSLGALEAKGLPLRRLPYSLRILLENLLRHEDGKSVTANDIELTGQVGGRLRSRRGRSPLVRLAS